MKTFLIACCLLPLLGYTQAKNVVGTNRFFPQTDKIVEFEKALSAHAQKYHTGDWSWRVFEILSGPDAGGYQVTEGPNSWAQLDDRGDISPEHTADFVKNVASLTTDRNQSFFATYRADLSTTELTAFTDKIAITHVFIKPGFSGDVENVIKKSKKAWEAGKQSVAVYESSASGPPQFILVFRYKDGWKERDSSYRKPFKERYNATNGEGSFEDYLEDLQKCVDRSWGEMLIVRKDLGSK
jgi:hypothetical protein